MTEPLYWFFMLSVVTLGVAGIAIIVRGRRKRENIYYWGSGVTFLLAIAVVMTLFEQPILSFAILIAAALLSIPFLPRIRELNRQETVKQIQETDVSAPLKIRELWNLQGWIKLKARYGFRKTITLYIIVTIGIFAAVLLAFIAIGLITTLTVAFCVIFTSTFLIIINYRQTWKALKKQKTS